jgi:hypothetical protein
VRALLDVQQRPGCAVPSARMKIERIMVGLNSDYGGHLTLLAKRLRILAFPTHQADDQSQCMVSTPIPCWSSSQIQMAACLIAGEPTEQVLALLGAARRVSLHRVDLRGRHCCSQAVAVHGCFRGEWPAMSFSNTIPWLPPPLQQYRLTCTGQAVILV